MVEQDHELDWNPHKLVDINSDHGLTRVGAVDISYSKDDAQKAVAALIIFEFPSFKVLYEDYEKDEAEYPYIPGFLAFKEVPSYSILFNRLKANAPELFPQIILVDGNGILHTRNFGCASHVGVEFGVPSIGVGKTVFAVDGLTQNGVKAACDQKLLKGGDVLPLIGDSGKIWGLALRATNESKNPLIVSIGHRVSLETALTVTKVCISDFRIPEPIRQADLRSRQKVKDIYDDVKN